MEKIAVCLIRLTFYNRLRFITYHKLTVTAKHWYSARTKSIPSADKSDIF